MPNYGIILIVTAGVIWLIVSIELLRYFRVFNSATLAAAPQRYSKFTGWHVASIVLLYVGVGLVAQACLQPAASSSATKPAATAAAATAATARAVAQSAASSAATEVSPDSQLFVRLQATDIAIRICGIAILMWLAQRNVSGGLRGFGLSGENFARGVGAGALGAFILVPWMVFTLIVTNAINQYFRGKESIHPVLEALGDHPSLPAQIILFAAALIIAPIAEELFFRGLLQTALLRLGRLMHRDGPDEQRAVGPAWRWWVIIFASVLFALVHDWDGKTPEVVPPIFLLAVTMGYLYERTGNLWASISIHALFNTVNTVAYLNGHA